MKWFKKMSNARTDKDLSLFLQSGGLEAYGFWELLCEIVAESMDKTEQTKAAHSVEHWRLNLRTNGNKMRRMLELCSSFGLIHYELSETLLEVSIPRLLKQKDDWNSRSVVTTESLRSNYGAKKEKESKEEERESEKVATLPKQSKRTSQNGDHRNGNGKPQSQEWLRLMAEMQDYGIDGSDKDWMMAQIAWAREPPEVRVKIREKLEQFRAAKDSFHAVDSPQGFIKGLWKRGVRQSKASKDGDLWANILEQK